MGRYSTVNDDFAEHRKEAGELEFMLSFVPSEIIEEKIIKKISSIKVFVYYAVGVGFTYEARLKTAAINILDERKERKKYE